MVEEGEDTPGTSLQERLHGRRGESGGGAPLALAVLPPLILRFVTEDGFFQQVSLLSTLNRYDWSRILDSQEQSSFISSP